MRLHRAVVRASVAFDLRLWMVIISDATQGNYNAGRVCGVFVHTMRLRSTHDRPMVAIKDAVGAQRVEPDEVREVWVDHWAQVSNGKVIKLGSLAEKLATRSGPPMVGPDCNHT